MAKGWGDAWRDYTGVKGERCPACPVRGTCGQCGLINIPYAERVRVSSVPTPKRSKYGAKKTHVDGITFDSAKEARRYSELQLRKAAGEISDIHLQPSYPIVINGQHVCTYRADFAYVDQTNGEVVVEDVKGFRNPTYILKRKLVEAQYGITITEV